VRCGDHGLFCTREAFDDVGGYGDVPLMEDVDFVRALHGLGRFVWLSDRLLLSARRHKQVGPYWYTFVCSAVVGLYCLGVGNGPLARLYGRMVPERFSESGDSALGPVEPALFSGFRENVEAPNKTIEGHI